MSDCDGTGNIVRSIDKYAKKEYNYEYEGGKVTHSTVYDGEERITKVIDSFDGITEYEYDALGQLKTETVNGTVVNNMTYDNYGNITEKNGAVYHYGNAVWKDLLTQVGTGANSTIAYDANGNPTTYLGHTLTWEKGRQLKKFDSIEYTYNANGIRTSKKGNGVLHTYTIDGTKILRETWGENTLVPLYDNGDSICGILYNSVSYYFIKNLQGDVIAIVDKDAQTVARYSYDAWACRRPKRTLPAVTSPPSTRSDIVGITTMPRRTCTTSRADTMIRRLDGLSMRMNCFSLGRNGRR